MNIGILGQGFVGNAIYQKFKNYYDVKTFDTKGMMHCNSRKGEVMLCDIIFVYSISQHIIIHYIILACIILSCIVFN